MEIVLENQDRLEIQEYLQECFQFPEYYGKNLDALYDCLTEICEDVEVTVIVKEDTSYNRSLCRVFERASKENEHILLSIE